MNPGATMALALSAQLLAGAAPGTIAPGQTLVLELPAGDVASVSAAVDLVATHDEILILEATALHLAPLLQVFRVDETGALDLLIGSRFDTLRGACHVRLEGETGKRYRVVVRPDFEDWGGKVNLSVAPLEEPPGSQPAPAEGATYWDHVALTAGGADRELQRARAALGRLYRDPARSELVPLEVFPPIEDALRFGLRAAAEWWRPRQRKLRVDSFREGILLRHRAEADASLEVLEQRLGSEHPAVGNALLQRGSAYLEARSLLEARPLIERARSILSGSLGKSHPRTALAQVVLARLYRLLGDLREAEELLEGARSVVEASLGPQSLFAAYVLEDQSLVAWEREHREEAVALRGRALQIQERIFGPGHPDVVERFRELVMFAAWAVSEDPAPTDLDAAERETLPVPGAWPASRALSDLVARFDAVVAVARETAFDGGLSTTLWGKWFASALFGQENEAATERRVMRFRVRLDTLLRRSCAAPGEAKACADTLVLWGATKEAEEVYGRLQRVGEREPGDEPPWLADVLRDQALFINASVPAARAFNDALRALDPKKVPTRIGPKDAALVRSLLRRVVSSRERPRGAPDLELTMALEELGAELWMSGNSVEATPILGRALDLQKELLPPRSLVLGRAYATRATVHAELGLFDEARSFLDRAQEILEIQTEPASNLRISQVLKLAWASRLAGRLEVTERLLRELPADESSAGCFGPLYLRREILLADLAVQHGRIQEGKHLVLDQIRRCHEAERSYGGLETVLEEDYKGRDRLGEAGLDEYVHGRRRRALRGLKLFGLGLASMFAAYYGANVPWFGVAKPAFVDVPAVDPRDVFYFETVGTILRSSELYGEGAAFLQGAIEEMGKGPGASHPGVVRLQTLLAETLWDGWDTAEAERRTVQAAVDAAVGLDGYLRDALSSLTEAQALHLVSTRVRPENVLFSGLLFGDEPSRWIHPAWDWTLRRRALVLDEMASRRAQALSSDDPAVADAWTSWLEARRRVAALWVQGPDDQDSDAYWDALGRAIRARQATEAALAEVSAAYRDLSPSRAQSWWDVASALPPRAVLIEYVRVSVRRRAGASVPHYVALILLPDRLAHADLGPAEPIDRLVLEWQDRLRRSYTAASAGAPLELEQVLASGGELRKAVWDPVAAEIPDANLVFIVPDGSLHQVNFYALPEEDRTFLIDRGQRLHLLSSGRDLIRLAHEERNTATGMLALGDPDYEQSEAIPGAREDLAGSTGPARGARGACSALRDRRWTGLPESRVEVESVGDLWDEWGPVEILVGAEATEARFKQAAPGNRIVHLATHGFFVNEECPSATRLGRGLRGAGSTLTTAGSGSIGSNPLLLSGLVLAGANKIAGPNREAEDGILTAEEIAALDLRTVQIAALSACDTGLGEVATGEGVFGLRRAFELAGARTVLMSLWPVPDRSARLWMIRFYQDIAAGLSVADSGRDAAQAALAALRAGGVPEHPYLWAGFVTAGSWR